MRQCAVIGRPASRWWTSCVTTWRWRRSGAASSSSARHSGQRFRSARWHSGMPIEWRRSIRRRHRTALRAPRRQPRRLRQDTRRSASPLLLPERLRRVHHRNTRQQPRRMVQRPRRSTFIQLPRRGPYLQRFQRNSQRLHSSHRSHRRSCRYDGLAVASWRYDCCLNESLASLQTAVKYPELRGIDESLQRAILDEVIDTKPGVTFGDIGPCRARGLAATTTTTALLTERQRVLARPSERCRRWWYCLRCGPICSKDYVRRRAACCCSGLLVRARPCSPRPSPPRSSARSSRSAPRRSRPSGYARWTATRLARFDRTEPFECEPNTIRAWMWAAGRQREARTSLVRDRAHPAAVSHLHWRDRLDLVCAQRLGARGHAAAQGACVASSTNVCVCGKPLGVDADDWRHLSSRPRCLCRSTASALETTSECWCWAPPIGRSTWTRPRCADSYVLSASLQKSHSRSCSSYPLAPVCCTV